MSYPHGHPVEVSDLGVVPRPDVEDDPEEHDAGRGEHEDLPEGDGGVDDAVGRLAALALPEDAGFQISRFLQGDQSGCFQPSVDIKTKVLLLPGLL